ncbi:mitochondrial carrier [Hesseltinella vesiculosa]|uniref:Mitochondrial carrier n=1 Tax=Hesseltinella vesiculosa TaxID=101127 RepID=A0A1X2GP32_9FUNG|nr:mitochondrial carrier [Hesseltinella vesiculosa]
MFKHEGILSFYKGMSSPLVGAMVENAALFVGYREIQRMIRSHSMTSHELDLGHTVPEDQLPPLSMPQLVLAGSLSGILASVVLTPVELIKCKLQVAQQLKGPLQVIDQVIRQHGIFGFYRGYLATMIREAGGGACWFGFYEFTCHQFIQRKQEHSDKIITKKDLAPTELMLGGALGGMAYNLSFYPIDVVKSHMQTDDVLGQKRQRSFSQTARHLYTSGSLGVFYRGCGLTVLRSAPTSAIIFMTYELLSRRFGG